MHPKYLSVALIAAAGFAQENDISDKRLEAIRNIEKLKVTITLDRQSYLPGEEMRASIRIVNDTSVRLTVPKPFASDNGLLFLQEKGNVLARNLGEEFGDRSPEQARSQFSGPLTELNPGEAIERAFRSSAEYDMKAVIEPC